MRIKRTLALVLALVMVLGMLPTTFAFAEETTEPVYAESAYKTSAPLPQVVLDDLAATGTINVSETTVVTGPVGSAVAVIDYGNTSYSFATLAEAIEKAQDGETIKLLKDASGEGVVIDKDVTIDFGGFTYTFTSGVGSGNLTSNGFQILQGNTVTLKNGKLDVAEESKEEFYILVQNYADLTVTDMVLDGTNLDKWSTSDGDSYVLSNNSGNVVINGKTDIIANDEGELAYAFDAFSKAGYEAPTVTVNTTGTINGNVEVTGGDLNVEAATINGALVYTAGNVTKAETVTLAAPEGYEWVNGVLTAVNYVAQIGTEKFETLDEALAAAQEGDTVTLLADATPALTSQRAITKAAVIDLGGHTLTLMEDDLYFGTTTFKNGTIVVDPSVKPSTAVFWMFANQTLTFDNVKLVATGVTGTYLIGLDGNNADLNLLNGSEIFIENTTALDLDVICVNASTGNDIVIDNSKVDVTNLDGRVFFRGNYTVSGNSDIDLEGITKAGFRIEAGQTLTIADTSTVDIVGEPRDGGIHLTDVTSVYTVAETATVNATVNKPGPVEVRTYEELVAALEKDNANVIMMNDITATATQATGYGKAGIVLNAGDVLDGNGNTLTINGAGGTWDCTVGMLGGELKKLTVSGGFRGVFMPGANGDVVIDNCTIENVVYTFNSDAGSTDYTVTIKNTELNGWTSYSAVHKSVEFEDCSFGEGSGYAFCRPYQATTFTGCDFAEGYKIDTAQVADNELAFSDCTYAGEALSAENGGKLFNDSGIVLVDGVSVDYNKVYVAQVGDEKYETLAEALAAEKEAGTTDLVITIIGTNDQTTADSFELPYGTAFDSVTIKQDNGGEPYYMATLCTGSRTNGGTFVFDGVNIIVTEQYMFEGNVKLANNSVVKSVAEANCFHYYSTTTVEPGSKLQGVIDEMRGGELIIDGGRTDGEYNSTPDAQDAIMSISWNGDSVTVKNGAYVKINAANEVGRLTVKSGASLNVYDSKLESYQWIANEGTINADIDSQITTQKITGAGTITVDATGFDGTAVKVIDADMSEFTGEIEIANASAGFEIKEDGIYVVKIPAIKVTYPNGTVEYYEDILEAVPYTTNCPRLEGAVVTLQKDISGQGLRLMENDMVLDLNGYTYTITAGTGSQNTNTSGFQIRPEVTTKATIKNGTIKVAEGAPVVWMFNSYATDFVVEDVVVDCANMAYSYGESVFVHVSRPGDNTNFTGTTKLVNFDAAKAGSIINVGGTMTIEETVEFDGTVELDVGATLTAPAGLTVVTADGYEVVYENGIYTTVEAVWDGETIASVKDFIAFAKASQSGESFSGKTIKLTADIDFEGANYLEIAEDGTVVTDYRIPKFSGTFDGQGYTIKNFNYVVKNCGKHNIMMFSQDNMWAYIKNLNIENVNVNIADISGQTKITALANRVNAGGMTSAAIENVHVKNFKIVCDNTTSNDLRIGGLAYFVQGSQLIAKDCSIEGFEVDVNEALLVGGAVAVVKSKCDFENVDVKAVFDIDKLGTSGVIGGFVGQTQDQGTGTTFTDCDVEVEMNLDSAESLIGGFIGSIGSVSQFYNCTTTGSIAVESGNGVSTSIGGFTGDLGWNGMFAPNVQHEFNNCVADVDITAVNANVGGFIGHSTVTGYPKRFMPAYFNGCVAKGDVKTESGAAGGFVGTGDRGIFNDCSASGNATGRIAGGFWGEIYPKAEAESTGGWSYQNKVVTHTDPNSKTIVLEGLTVTGTATGTEYEADLIGFMKDIYVNDDGTLGYATPVVMAGNNTSEYNRYHYPVYVVQVTYADGSVEYFENVIDAVPYKTNYDKLQGATVTLLKDASGQGLRMMENDLVIDLNGYTYTIDAGTGSQGTTTQGFQIRPEVTGTATLKNGTVKIAEGTTIAWMFNSYAANFVVEDVVVDCTNMSYDAYGSSTYLAVVQAADDNVVFAGDTKIVGFDTEAAGTAIVVGGTMTIEETVEFDGTVELDAGATLTAPAGLTVVTVDGYEVVYENGVYTTVEAKDYVAETNGVKYESLAEAIANGTSVTLLANTDEAVEVSKVVTINRNGYTADNLIGVNGYVVLNSLNDQYVIGEEPTATANNLGEKIIPEGEWNQYTGSLTPGVGDLPLSFVMQFKADQDEADMATSPYADWYGDFVLTFTGIEEGSFTADGCYLAGFYGDFGWIKIPVDGMKIENGTRYPVMLGVGMGQKYDYICTGVQDFLCALYIPDEILAANPNLEVNLELAVVDNSQGSDAARDALIANENVYEVADHTYTAADFKTSVAKIGETFYATLAKAVEAAEAGAVIELLANTDEVVTVNMALTINKNGYTAANVTAGADVLMAVYENKYAFGTLPNAEIELLNDILVDVDSHYIYDLVGNQSLTTSTDPFNLQVAMKFTAKDTLEQAQANAFSGYTTDFFIKIDGLTQESFVGDGCYLAGYYPWDDKSVDDGLWVVIPLDGFTVENGVVYPMISAAGFDFKYTDIVSSVGQFICGIYLTPEVMEANPNLTVQLDLGLSENQTEAQKSNYIEVDTSIYDVEDINVPYVAQVTTAKFKALSEAVAYGDAVELLADTDEAVVLNVNTVINRNGFTASALSAAAGYEVVETADTYTVAEVVIPDAKYGFSDSMQAFLSLESIVEMNVGFKMTKDNVELTPEEAAPFMDKVGLLVWKGAAVSGEATIENSEIVLTNVTYNTDKNRFEVKTDGIPAKEMGDALCFRPYYVDENGNYSYGRLIEDYSPKKYSYIQIAAGGADTAVNIALLNYGAAAQVHFNYNVDNLMNADLTDEQKAMNWDGTLVRSDWAIPEGKEGNLTRAAEISTRGAYLSLEGTIDVNFYSMADAEIVKAEMLLWNEADYNAADVLSEENASQIANMSKNESKNRYEYKYEGIAAKEMFFPIYGCAKFTDVNGNVYYSGVVAYCAERAAYVGQNDVDANLADLYKRIAIYGDAARTYFGNR